jgi:hypothetical protein
VGGQAPDGSNPFASISLPNQVMNQLKSLSWRHLVVCGLLSDGQVWTSRVDPVSISSNGARRS